MIFYIDGPATIRKPELLKVTWALLVSQKSEYRAYVFDSGVYQVDKTSVRTFQVRNQQSLIPEAIDHAQTTHPAAKRYIVLTDNKYDQHCGPQTQHPERWIWISTKIHKDRDCRKSGNWIACNVGNLEQQQETLQTFRKLIKN